MPAPTSPSRILIIRLSAFGDVVIATSLLHGLKRAFPTAQIDWLVQPELASVLQTETAIHQVFTWPRKHWGQLWRSLRWLTLWRTVRAFSASLRARDYDLVVDAQGLLKSRVLAHLAGGRWRIGYASKEPLGFLLHQLVTRDPEAHPRRRFIGDEHAPMLHALTGQREVIPALTPPHATIPGDAIVLAPFTTRPQKHWPDAHWRALIAQLLADGHRLTMLGGPADQEAAARLLEGFEAQAIGNQVGRTRLPEALALIAAARLVIGVDTGLTHAGFALGRPTLALFGSTRPYAAAREAHSQVLFIDLPCAPCGRKPTCGGAFTCLQALTPAQVRRAVQTVTALHRVLP